MGVKYVFVFCLYIYEIHKWHYGLLLLKLVMDHN
jgi:hypothetical protein